MLERGEEGVGELKQELIKPKPVVMKRRQSWKPLKGTLGLFFYKEGCVCE